MSLLGEPYQVLSDCPHCLVEAAVVELMDPMHPASHLGVAVEVRCRCCGWRVVAADEAFAPRMPVAAGRCPACHKHLDEAARTGSGPCPHCGYHPTVTEAAGPGDLRAPNAARAALQRWANEEGEPDLEAFCSSNMGIDVSTAIRKLTHHEQIGTTFDVIAYLFPSGAGGGRSDAVEGDAPFARPIPLVDREPEPVREPEPLADLTLDPRAPARVLVSVMVADGELRAGERAFVDAFLDREGLPRFTPADLRVWRANELGPITDPELRERLLEACIHLMHLDRERDGSEWKVIRSYARAWGIPESQLVAWDTRYERKYTPTMRQLWRTLSRLVRS